MRAYLRVGVGLYLGVGGSRPESKSGGKMAKRGHTRRCRSSWRAVSRQILLDGRDLVRLAGERGESCWCRPRIRPLRSC